MPIFFQHQSESIELVVWEQQETESFFTDQLPVQLFESLPGHPSKRIQFLAGRFLLRYLRPEFPLEQIKVLETGRPFLADGSLEFSISHAGSMIAAIIHPNAPVGIDVEMISERAGRIRRKFLSETEEALLQKRWGNDWGEPTSMTLAWSVKEAAFKALQQGGVDFIRDLPLEQVDVSEKGWNIKLGRKGSLLKIQTMILDQVCLSWATKRVES